MCAHTSRVRITAALTATAHSSSSPAGRALSPSRIDGSCSPISTNSSALSRKTSVSQTAKPWIRMRAVEIRGARQPSTMPAVTAASTPETCSASAGR